MQQQWWEQAERRKSQKRKSQKKENAGDAGARKCRKVAIHCAFPMFWGSGGSESRLAKAGGAEPSRGMKDENYKDTSSSEHFKFRRANSARRCGAKHTSKWKNSSGSDHFGKSEAQFWVKMLKHPMFGPFFGVEASFYVAGTQWSLHLVKSVSDVWVLRQFQHDSRRGIFEKRICKTNQKDACCVAGASGTVQETSSSCC